MPGVRIEAGGLVKSSTENIDAIFDYWKLRFNHPRARLDKKRRTKIRLRLEDGYTLDDLKLAIDGCRASPFHLGQNDRNQVYDDIELICRDAPHVDRFIALGEKLNEKRAEQQRQVEERQQTNVRPFRPPHTLRSILERKP